MPNQLECPSRETLVGWATGTLSDDVEQGVADHVENCAHCEELLASIEANSTLTELKVSAAGQGFAQEAQLREFVQAIQNVPPPVPSNFSKPVSGRQIRDYELLEQIGQGAMGTVFKARHTRLNKLVAIKLLSGKLSSDPSAVARFAREMHAVGHLNHPNIVQALDAGDEDGTSFLVMELLEGLDLAALTSPREPLEIVDACAIVRQAAIGMEYAHAKGLVHRDLKPSNLFLTRDSNGQCLVKVLDLGLAMIDRPEVEGHLTDTGQLMGTLEFMAPEQAEDTHAVDSRADIFSLGATLFKLLTGTVPLEGPEYNRPLQRLKTLTTTQVPSISSRRSDLPEGLVALVDKMLARDADERPDMAEIVSSLNEFSLANQLDALLQSSSAQHRGISTESLRDTDSIHGQKTDVLPEFGPEKVKPNRHGPTSVKGTHRLLAGAAALIFASSVIWLKTDGGYIQIDVADPKTQVEVEICQDGLPVDTVKIGSGRKKFWYRSGQYEIRIVGQKRDVLEIVGSDVTVTRGSERAVVIKRISSSGEQPNDALPNSGIVTTTEDDPDVAGSLRQVIALAKPGETIRFAPKLAGKTIFLNGSPLKLDQSVTLDGGDLIDHVVINGNQLSRVFDIRNRAQVQLEGVTVTGGKDYAPGGGIAVNQASLSMRNCILSKNSTRTNGGGIFCENGNIVLENCLVVGNEAAHLGGGLANYGGVCLFKNCVFTGNSSGGPHGAAALNVNAGKMELVHCTVTGNLTSGVSSHQWATLILDSSIITGNGATKNVWIQKLDGGGIITRGMNLIEHLNADVKSGPAPMIARGMLAPLDDYGGLMPTVLPLPDSPAIDAAQPTSATPSIDMRGFERPADGNGDGDAQPDIGAAEFSLRDLAVNAQVVRRNLAEWIFERNGSVRLGTGTIRNLTELAGDELQILGVEVHSLSGQETRELASQLQHIPECHHLYVGSDSLDPIADEDLRFLGNLTQLKSLSIRSVKVTQNGIEKLVQLKKLTSFALSKTAITSDLLSRIGEMFSRLESLSIEIPRIEVSHLKALAKVPQLKRIDLNATQVPPSSMRPLDGSHFKEITLRGPWHLTADLVESLSLMPQLKVVTFFDVKLDKQKLQQLLNSQTLRSINSFRSAFPLAEVEKLKKQYPKITIMLDGEALTLDSSNE